MRVSLEEDISLHMHSTARIRGVRADVAPGCDLQSWPRFRQLAR